MINAFSLLVIVYTFFVVVRAQQRPEDAANPAGENTKGKSQGDGHHALGTALQNQWEDSDGDGKGSSNGVATKRLLNGSS